eukprot:TRINITY_DN10745_c0_g1_i3.p1 TRINITY_DN10745_c0_g1~~TRINITY_DN10745_c0_g1_i3.p1  ORF type:complete len:292 (-),score=76.36 TRINITY_DN10745_c0_g1_i3:213-1088(-)
MCIRDRHCSEPGSEPLTIVKRRHCSAMELEPSDLEAMPYMKLKAHLQTRGFTKSELDCALGKDALLSLAARGPLAECGSPGRTSSEVEEGSLAEEAPSNNTEPREVETLSSLTQKLEASRVEQQRLAAELECERSQRMEAEGGSDFQKDLKEGELKAMQEELQLMQEGPEPLKGETAVYIPTAEVVLVASVHIDDSEVYYTVVMPDGREKQTVRSRLVSVRLPQDGAGLTLPEAQRLRDRVRRVSEENDLLRAEMIRMAPPTMTSKIGSFLKSVTEDAKSSIQQLRGSGKK